MRRPRTSTYNFGYVPVQFGYAPPDADCRTLPISMGNCLGVETTASTTGDSFVDVLFFPDPAMPCRNFHSDKGCTRKNCKPWTSASSPSHATTSRRPDAHARGVKVRVITDDGQAKGKGSDIQKFIDAGIPVRDDNARTYMHHKFCVIDKKILLNGSFNWSRQAVVGNAENLVIHKDGPIIGRFDEHFTHLWNKYER
ncbi:hypothetical protein PF001_g23139 [Phytophthora fragariae]|nr:hypothetical protein PF001_g23139 [Phytophthora fragariae]KAE9298696.1 hypothetical protein PF008_g23438 [Phytophthora fragariae]